MFFGTDDGYIALDTSLTLTSLQTIPGSGHSSGPEEQMYASRQCTLVYLLNYNRPLQGERAPVPIVPP